MTATLPRILVTACLATVMLCGCGSPQRAAVKDLQLLRRALSDAHEYPAAVAELEKHPQAALRALEEQSAAAGTRKDLLLHLITDRVGNAGRYAAWDGVVQQTKADLSPLTRRRHIYFWSEKLLFGDSAAGVLAVRHLNAIDSDAAAAVLSFRVIDTTRDPDAGFKAAAASLGRSGRVEELVRAMSEWLDSHAVVTDRAIADLREATRLLPAQGHEQTERRLLAALQKPELGSAQRRARLIVLEQVAGAGSIEPLAKLRRLPWGSQLRGEIDAVVIAAMSRDVRLAQFGVQGESKP